MASMARDTSAGQPAEANSAPRSGGFLVALLRGGAPVIGDVPPDLPDQAVDPEPQPGWRRISMISASTGRPRTDTLLVRACRYVVLLPLVYRIVAAPVMLLGYLAAGPAPAAPMYAVAAFCVAGNIAALVWVLRVAGFRTSVARALLVGDATVAVLLSVFLAVSLPDPWFAEAAELSWVYLIGSVSLWTLAWGVPAGLALTGAAVPLHALLGLLGHPDPAWSGLAAGAGDLLALLAGLVTSVIVLILIGLGTRLALGVGIRSGREAERARGQRFLHDSVLQTLEVIAMPLPTAPPDLATALATIDELRNTARAQVMELRRDLVEPSGAPDGLGTDLASLATEMAREGLRAQLVFADVDDGALSEARRLAVRDAAREALRNTMKHAGTTDVVVRVEQRDGGIAVIARDHGTGFSESDRPAGFGISQSISARLSEVGGSALVESKPGHGTRVVLWVPL